VTNLFIGVGFIGLHILLVIFFFTHLDLVKLLDAFTIVLLMHSTYKSKKYKLSFLEIIGFTSIGLTFSIAFVLLSSKCENNFIWTLKRLRWLFLRVDIFPQVIVDRDLCLMNAINFIFPKTCNLLCQFHINKNTKEKCKMLVDSRETLDTIMDTCKILMDCSVCDAFEGCLKHFECVCLSWPLFFDYVNKTCVIP